MTVVTFAADARSALGECLARAYPSAHPDGELVVEPDHHGRPRLVLTDVPTGVGVQPLFPQVSGDVRNGVLVGLRNMHDESREVGTRTTRLVFTPLPDADLAAVAEGLRASFARARTASRATLARISALVAVQDLAVDLGDGDWWAVHDVLADAAARFPDNPATVQAARLVRASVFPDDESE